LNLNKNPRKVNSLLENLEELLTYEIDNKNPNEEISIHCPVTNKKIYKIKNGIVKYINSHGLCRVCGQDFYINQIFSVDEFKNELPIKLYDAICKRCNIIIS